MINLHGIAAAFVVCGLTICSSAHAADLLTRIMHSGQAGVA